MDTVPLLLSHCSPCRESSTHRCRTVPSSSENIGQLSPQYISVISTSISSPILSSEHGPYGSHPITSKAARPAMAPTIDGTLFCSPAKPKVSGSMKNTVIVLFPRAEMHACVRLSRNVKTHRLEGDGGTFLY